jgi:tellurite resistance protein
MVQERALPIPSSLIAPSTVADREAALEAAWRVARAHRLRSPERAALEAIRRELHLPESTAERIASATGAERPPLVTGALPKRERARRLVLHCALRVAAADGDFAGPERAVAETVGATLGLSPSAVEAEWAFLRPLPTPPPGPPRRRNPPAAGPLTSMALGIEPLAILVTNLIPIAGVLYFDWGVFTILFMFWLENGIIGFLHARGMRRSGIPAVSKEVPSFMAGYGGFLAGQGLILALLFLQQRSPEEAVSALRGRWDVLLATFLALIFQHAYAHRCDVLRRGDVQDPDTTSRFFVPFSRLILMHLTVLGAGFGLEQLGSPLPGLLLLIGLKTVFDLIAWSLRLPATGILGRLRSVSRTVGLAALFSALGGFLFIVLPAGVLGAIAWTITEWTGQPRVGGERWIFYGGGVAALVTVAAALIAGLHELLNGCWKYREAGKATRIATVAFVLAALVAIGTAPALSVGRTIRAKLGAATPVHRIPGVR